MKKKFTNNRRYRYLALCCILTLLFGIVGCGAQEKVGQKENETELTETQEVNATQELTVTLEPTETQEPTETPESTAMQEATTPEPTATPESIATPTFSAEGLNKAQAGDTVIFGTYEQDNVTSNGAEAIEWYVLDRKGDELLLLSKYCLDAQPYHVEQKYITWKDCTLRSWLNSEFYNTAFSSEEQSYIKLSKLVTADNSEHGTDGGEDTEDKVFALSFEELNKYFSSTQRMFLKEKYWEYSDSRVPSQVTKYAAARGASVSNYGKNDGSGLWWLRTMGQSQIRAMDVTYGPDVFSRGDKIDMKSNSVRPALCVSLNP